MMPNYCTNQKTYKTKEKLFSHDGTEQTDRNENKSLLTLGYLMYDDAGIVWVEGGGCPEPG